MFTYLCCDCYSYDVDDVYILGLSAVVNSKTEEKKRQKRRKKNDERTNRKKYKTAMCSNGCHILLARNLKEIKIYLFERKKMIKFKSIFDLN